MVFPLATLPKRTTADTFSFMAMSLAALTALLWRYVLQIIPKPKGVENQVQTVLQTLKFIEKHVIQARYPLKDERGKLTPPSEYYDKEKAEELLNKARTILEKTETTIKATRQ